MRKRQSIIPSKRAQRIATFVADLGLKLDSEDYDAVANLTWNANIRNSSWRFNTRIDGMAQTMNRFVLSRKLGRKLLTDEYAKTLDGSSVNLTRDNLVLVTRRQATDQIRDKHNAERVTNLSQKSQEIKHSVVAGGQVFEVTILIDVKNNN